MAGDPQPSHTLRALAERVADGVHISDSLYYNPSEAQPRPPMKSYTDITQPSSPKPGVNQSLRDPYTCIYMLYVYVTQYVVESPSSIHPNRVRIVW